MNERREGGREGGGGGRCESSVGGGLAKVGNVLLVFYTQGCRFENVLTIIISTASSLAYKSCRRPTASQRFNQKL